MPATEAAEGCSPVLRLPGLVTSLPAAETATLPPDLPGPVAVVQAARGAFALAITLQDGRLAAIARRAPADHLSAPVAGRVGSCQPVPPPLRLCFRSFTIPLSPSCCKRPGMHEMSLVEGIRAIVLDQAAVHGFARVTRLRLEIGRFAGVEKAALSFAWDVAMLGTPAAGAVLEMIDLPASALCFDCDKTVAIDDRLAPCPLCGGGRLLPEGGDDLRIKDMEVL